MNIVNRQERLGDEKMRAAEIKIGKQSHLQSAARGEILKIGAVRRDKQLSAEKARPVVAESPRHIGLFRFNLLHVNSFRQKNCKPRLGLDCFGIRLVNLDLNVARSNVHVAEPPLPHKQAPWVKPGADTVSIERFQRFLSIARLETFALRR